jgi:uncharacterized protein
MIILLSPAKIQNFKPESCLMVESQPHFLQEASELVAQIRQLSIRRLGDILKINPDLAKLNAERYGLWQTPFTPQNAKAAVQVFNGEVYHGLDVRSLSMPTVEYMQEHLRLFSGLYGLLNPFDLIQPYRLDFGDSFRTTEGETLYAFWSKKITAHLNESLKKTKETKVVLNLASGEYIKSIDKKKLNATIIDVDFLQMQPQGLKTIVVYTKKARGMLTRYVLENRITDPEDLKSFDAEGYFWNASLSNKNKLVFTR